VKVGHRDVVELLLASKGDVKIKDDDGKTPSQIAAYGQLELAALLRPLGITAQISDPQQATTTSSASTAAPRKQFKIISITRTKEYPPPPDHPDFKSRDGYVFIAVDFVPVPLETTDDYPSFDDGLRHAFLVDSLGEKHGSVTIEFAGRQKINGLTVPKYATLLFPMKEGAKPQEMLVKDLSTDLTKTPEKKPPSRPATKSTKK
jgi:hypothetical protein